MPRNTSVLTRKEEATPLGHARMFMSEHGEAVQGASRLLGGEVAYRRAQRLICDLRDTRSLTRRLRTELVHLHRLLRGEGQVTGDNAEVIVDPEDPIVHDLCRLADRLCDLLHAVAEGGGSAPDVAAYLQRIAA